MVGVVFFVGAGLYIIFLPIAALLTRKIKGYKKFLFFGTICCGFGMLIIAPSMGIPH